MPYTAMLGWIFWRNRGIEWHRVIISWHDQSIVGVPIDKAEEVRHIMGVEAYARLNKLLGGAIPIRGGKCG